jgi:transcription antitermination factor NusG
MNDPEWDFHCGSFADTSPEHRRRSHLPQKTVMQFETYDSSWAELQPGDLVTITKGPLTGLQGRFDHAHQQRLVLSLILPQAQFTIELERSWAHPVAQQACVQSAR